MGTTEGVCVHCFTRPGATRGMEARSADGRPAVTEVQRGPVAAVVGLSPSDEMGGLGVSPRAWDAGAALAWAFQHERVIAEIQARSPVLPLRPGTVVASTQEVQRVLAGQGDAIARFLDDVDGKEEWAVRGSLDLNRAAAWLTGSDVARAAGARNGDRAVRPFFEDARALAAARDLLRPWRQAVAEEACRELGARAVAVRAAEAGPGQEGAMVLHCAFLVRRGRVGEFLASVERVRAQHATRGFALVASGPWPPYSFCPPILEEPEEAVGAWQWVVGSQSGRAA